MYRFKRFRTPRWYFLLLVLFLILAAVVWDGEQAPVQAKSNYLTSFRNTYPAISGTQLDTCNTCHTSVPTLNPFGNAYRNAGHNFAAIEQTDSDGDGFSNLVEIQALTFPGDAGSHPPGQATATPTTAPTATATAAPGATATPTSTPVGPPTQSEYQLIGWNDLGMHCMNESFKNAVVLPPFNTFWAQVIRTGPDPEIVTDGVVIEYSFQNNTTSVGKTNFWDYVQQLFGVSLPPDVGLTGAGLRGQMHTDGDHFVIEGVPLTPYEDGKPHVPQPYQLADLVARDAASGEVIASTTFVAPVSTEMHCDDCHVDGMEGVATGQAETNILALHDKEEGTDLLHQRPVLCANCHASNALGMGGNPNLPNLSHAIHSVHADGEGDGGGDDEGDECKPGEDDCDDDTAGSTHSPLAAQFSSGDSPTCYQCHPGPETACLRGVMAEAGLTCESCHGDLNAVANPARNPWVDLPRCGDCHGQTYAENPGKLFRASTGHGGLYCEACHGSTHAILPSTEPRDNMQVIRLQGWAGTLTDCTVCHGDAVPAGPGPHGMTNPNPTPEPTMTPTATPPGATPTPTPTTEPTATPQGEDAKAWLNPDEQSVSIDHTLTLELWSDKAPVGGFEAVLHFDPAILQAQTAVLGDWLDGVNRTVTPLGPTIDNHAGRIQFGAFSFGNGTPPHAAARLARFEFKAVAAGHSPVTLELTLTDAAGNVIPAELHAAAVTVQALAGDLNGDCQVNVADIMLVAAAWGMTASDPGWNPQFDLNSDGAITVADIMLVAGQWGETCSAGASVDASVSAQVAASINTVAAIQPADGSWLLNHGLVEVAVAVSDAQKLGGYEAAIRYDPAVLRFVDVAGSDWLSSTGRKVVPLGPQADADRGVVSFGAFSFGQGQGVSGEGVVATLRFEPLAAGKSTLDFSDVVMSDDAGTTLAVQAESGVVRIDPGESSMYLPLIVIR